MKVAGTFLVALAIAIGAIQWALLTSSYPDTTDYLLLLIPAALAAAGIALIRKRRHRRAGGTGDKILRALFTLLVAIPIGTATLVALPTFIASFFLPPGDAQWVAIGLAAIILPVFLVMWWINVKMVFSKSYRGVGFANPDHQARYGGVDALSRTRPPNPVKTSQRRAGTTRAKAKHATGSVFYTSVMLVVSALTHIPLLGLVFVPLRNLYFMSAGARLDALRDTVERLEAPTLDELLEADPRSPVLLLRSFADDGIIIESLEPEFKNTSSITYEELVCREAETWGPVVAIGDPTEELPRLGAARAYYTNETWQEHAVDLLQRARLVVVVMGKTPSVCWELGRILVDGHATKTVVLIPPTTGDGYALRVTRLQDIIEEVTGARPAIDLPPGHQMIAAAFTPENDLVPISGPLQVSIAFADALKLGSKVVAAEHG